MTPTRRALSALQTLARFEMADAAMRVVQTVTLHQRAREQVDTLARSSDRSAKRLRSMMTRGPINLPLVEAMRRLYHGECSDLHEARGRLTTARKYEEDARDALAGIRNRERSIERAIVAQRWQEAAKREAAEHAVIDELWLQRRRLR